VLFSTAEDSPTASVACSLCSGEAGGGANSAEVCQPVDITAGGLCAEGLASSTASPSTVERWANAAGTARLAPRRGWSDSFLPSVAAPTKLLVNPLDVSSQVDGCSGSALSSFVGRLQSVVTCFAS